MEAVQFYLSTKELTYKRLSKPTISSDDELVIEVAFAGLCGTDLHIIQGEFPCSQNPLVLGHEFSGVVREVGRGVVHVKPGERVVIDPQHWCTTCENCTSGKYHLCTAGGVECATGINIDGGWATFAKARARQVYKLPPSVSLKQGALCEPVSCIVWGLERGVRQIPVGSDILISGAGIIGNLWSAVLHHLGHRKVTVIEPAEQRREINQSIDTGFRCLCPESLERKERFDLVIECSGNGKAIEGGFNALKHGGTLLLFGVASPHTLVQLSPYEIFKRELTIVGSNINPFSMKKAIGLIEAMGDRYIISEKLGIKEYSLKEYREAIECLKTGAVAKVMFQINPNL